MLQHHIVESLRDKETLKQFTEYSKKHGKDCPDMNQLY